MLVLAGIGALALAARWSPAARWMIGAVGFLGAIVAVLALLTVLLRLLLIAGLAGLAAVAVATGMWPQAGAVLAIVGGAFTFLLVTTLGFSYAFGRWI